MTNTSSTSEVEEHEEEVIIPSVNLQAGTTQADTQEETLQLESSDIEDTGIKKVDTQEDQNTGPTEVQNKGDADERAVPDLIGSQIEEDDTTPENDGDDYISNDQDPAMQDNQTSKAFQDDNYHTAIGDDLDDTVQFGNPVTQPFLSRSVRVPTTEVGCLSFTQMFQDYSQEYPSPSQADAFLQIQEMVQKLDVYLNRYPVQYINYITSDSKFVAFVNHAIQFALYLTAYPNIWAVLSILLETQDVNTSYVQVMHDYYNECYNTKTQEYMTGLEQAAERSKNNMCNNTPEGVSANIRQQVCNPQMQSTDQYDVDAENHTQVLYHAHFNDVLTHYPTWSTDTNDMENTNKVQYRENRQDILNAWQTDTPVKTPDNKQVLDNIEAYT